MWLWDPKGRGRSEDSPGSGLAHGDEQKGLDSGPIGAGIWGSCCPIGWHSRGGALSSPGPQPEETVTCSQLPPSWQLAAAGTAPADLP